MGCVFLVGVFFYYLFLNLPPENDTYPDRGQTMKGRQLCIKLGKIDLPSEITSAATTGYG